MNHLPKPFYEDDFAVIYHGDSKALLPFLTGFDLLLTDPPYGLKMDKLMRSGSGKQYGVAAAPKRDYGETNWDESIPDAEHFRLMLGAAKTHVIFGGNYFTEHLPPTPSWIVWDKKFEGYTNDFADGEMAWCSTGKPMRILRYLWSGMLQGNSGAKEFREHPTQKPVPLLIKVLDLYPDAKTIIDPFMGSGSTLRAAKDIKRKAVGIERELQYCEVAV